jgi:hypothetical protein
MACRSSTAWDALTNQIAEDSGENGETDSRVRLLGGSGAVAQGEPWYAASVWLQTGKGGKGGKSAKSGCVLWRKTQPSMKGL